MKQNIKLPLLFLFFIACKPTFPNAEYSSAYIKIASLIEENQFFVARELYHGETEKLSKTERLVLGAELDNLFNKPGSSNDQIASVRKNKNSLPDSIYAKLLEIEASNYVRLGEYAKAFSSTTELLDNFSQLLDSKQKESYKTNQVIWKTFSKEAPQKVIKSKDVSLPITRDRAGLANLQVSNTSESVDFIFDTGANISTITESTAKQFRMKLFETTIKVGSITGKQVDAKLAICEKIQIGNISIQNAIFIVFPDKQLYIEPIDFQINGIIGFPIINALEEIHLLRNDTLFIPSQSNPSEAKNLALDLLTPVINIDNESYTFDTGAKTTILYESYFVKHQNRIEKEYKTQELSFGGAGGTRKIEGYEITFEKDLFNKNIRLDSVMLVKEDIKESNENYYGNIGQDVIHEYDKTIINFKDMYIRFEDN